MVNHVHLRDIRGEDLDLGAPAAQVDQDPAWGDQTRLTCAQPTLSCPQTLINTGFQLTDRRTLLTQVKTPCSENSYSWLANNPNALHVSRRH